MVKNFVRPADSQISILDEFQKHGWPPVVDDPSPPIDGEPLQRRKRRLNDTVRELNSGHKNRAVSFHSTSMGESIRWQPIVAEQDLSEIAAAQVFS
jgi:hypothetical protein